MTQDEIIDMARKSDFEIHLDNLYLGWHRVHK